MVISDGKFKRKPTFEKDYQITSSGAGQRRTRNSCASWWCCVLVRDSFYTARGWCLDRLWLMSHSKELWSCCILVRDSMSTVCVCCLDRLWLMSHCEQLCLVGCGGGRIVRISFYTVRDSLYTVCDCCLDMMWLMSHCKQLCVVRRGCAYSSWFILYSSWLMSH